MKKILFLASSLLLAFSCGAQTFWLENWTGTTCTSLCTTYTGPNGAWTSQATGYNGPAANVWYFSNTEQGMGRGQCGSASGSHPTAHVGNVSTSPAAGVICPTGDCGALNDDWPGAPSDGTRLRLQSPVINCTGKSNISLSFNYIEQGDSLEDFATVWYYDGTTWSYLSKPHSTNNTSCSGAGKWTHYAVALPASANNNANVKIGFNWFNDTLGTASLTNNPADWPSFAVDSVGLSSGLPLGIHTAPESIAVSVYPNPNNGKFTLEITPNTAKTKIHFYNLLGQEVFAQDEAQVQNRTVIDLSEKPAGVYFYRIESERGEPFAQGKFLIQ